MQEVVVLTRVLAAEVNYGYQEQERLLMKLLWQDLSCCQLLSFQRQPVQSLSDLQERLRDSRDAAFLRFNLSPEPQNPWPQSSEASIWRSSWMHSTAGAHKRLCWRSTV